MTFISNRIINIFVNNCLSIRMSCGLFYSDSFLGSYLLLENMTFKSNNSKSCPNIFMRKTNSCEMNNPDFRLPRKIKMSLTTS